MKEGRSVFKVLTGKPIRKRPQKRPRRRWEDNIRLDFKYKCADCAQNGVYLRALENLTLNLRIP